MGVGKTRDWGGVGSCAVASMLTSLLARSLACTILHIVDNHDENNNDGDKRSMMTLLMMVVMAMILVLFAVVAVVAAGMSSGASL